MIACPTCGNVNPFTTRFCRKCGARLELKVAQVADALDRSKAVDRDDRVFRAGSSALSLTVFLGICALCLRLALVPGLPEADLPPLPAVNLLPSQLAQPVAPAESMPSPRLQWRHDHLGGILSALGVDVVHLASWQAALLGTQREDGSFPGADPLASTALGALAVQAYPMDDVALASAQRARTCLHAEIPNLGLRPALSRTLCVAALLDADDLSAADWGATETYLEDGHAAVWQAYALTLLPASERSSHLDLLAAASSDGVWAVLMGMLGGAPAAVPASGPDLFTAAAVGLPSGEQRLLWAFTAWQVPAPPQDLATAFAAWSRSAPAAIDAETQSACGAHADSEVAILTLCAPGHVLPLWFLRQ